MTRATKIKQPTGHEIFCLENAAYFVAVRGRRPADRIRREVATIEDARAFAAEFNDGRTMIYAITDAGNSAHIENA